MDDLWQQFHRLPKAIRDSVSRPDALAAVDSLEQRYPSLDLASFVMRVVVKEVPAADMAPRLHAEYALSDKDAETVAEELLQTVFSPLRDYLGVSAPTPAVITSAVPPVSPQTQSASIVPPPPPPSNLPVAEVATVPEPVLPKITPPAATLTPVTGVAMSAPTGPIAPTQAYSDEDAAEIAQQARKLQSMSGSTSASPEEIAQKLIDQHRLAFHDEVMAKRAVAIIKARLKDIRNKDETLMMLVRGPKVGGLGLDQDLAKALVDDLETKAVTMKDRGMTAPRETLQPAPPPPMPPLAEKKPEPKPPLFRDAATAPSRPGLAPLPNISTPSTPPLAPKPQPAIKRPADIPLPPEMGRATPTVPIKPTVSKPSQFVKGSRTIERPAIADITRPVKMLGPAEEMRTMTLMEFRRLGQGANESTKRLYEKFEQLKHESFTIWAEALSGWRQSEVYQLYLSMGRQSMEQAISITEVIKKRSVSNELYLSEHEFSALADLNRQLQS